MFFLNLSAVEFLSLLGALGGLVTALYLLDRAKRRKIVSTLRFWAAAGAAEQHQSRRKMNDPWSLLLQLLSLALLLLALSRVQWGHSGRRGHDHVLLLDTSSWTAAPQPNSSENVLSREKQLLLSYFDRLPRNDRAMLVSADGLATPLTGFTADKQRFEVALGDASTSSSALNLSNALSFARQAAAWSDREPGEIVYTGPGMIAADPPAPAPPNLRVLSVPANRENAGVLHLNVAQVPAQPNTWQALAVLENYGDRPTPLRLSVRYGGTRFAPRSLTLAPHATATAEFVFTTEDAGDLTASLTPGGSLSADDSASVSVPRNGPLQIAVFTDRPQLLRPLFPAGQSLQATFNPTAAYRPNVHAAVVVLDRFAPAVPPSIPSLWLDPPPAHSPLPVLGSVSNAVMNWTADSSIDTLPLREKPVQLSSAHTFATQPGDRVIAAVPASAASAPAAVVVARQPSGNRPASAVVGFDPEAGELRFEVSTPLLFADLLEWLAPDSFRTLSLSAQTVGLADLPLNGAEANGRVQVTDTHGLLIPAVRRGHVLQVFSDRPASLRVVTDERTRLVSLRLPAVASRHWDSPAGVASGLPAASWYAPPPLDLWKWLAIAAAICLIAEWLLFARIRRFIRRGLRGTSKMPPGEPKDARQNEGELIAR